MLLPADVDVAGFAVVAAISAVHARAPLWDQTDWREVVGVGPRRSSSTARGRH